MATLQVSLGPPQLGLAWRTPRKFTHTHTTDSLLAMNFPLGQYVLTTFLQPCACRQIVVFLWFVLWIKSTTIDPVASCQAACHPGAGAASATAFPYSPSISVTHLSHIQPSLSMGNCIAWNLCTSHPPLGKLQVAKNKQIKTCHRGSNLRQSLFGPWTYDWQTYPHWLNMNRVVY